MPPDSKLNTAMPLFQTKDSHAPRSKVMLLHLDKIDDCDFVDDNKSISKTVFQLFLLHYYKDAF